MIMKPLISGPNPKRYEEPETETYLLFPYERDVRGAMRLIPADVMVRRFPLAWTYLCRCESILRKREHSSFDDDYWYRFGRNQNIDKQDSYKLIVPRLVQHLKCAVDRSGRFGLDNVDVGGVLSADGVENDF